jgi:hypothetical protein
MFVLDTLADDFEHFSKIVSEVSHLSQACGLIVEQCEIGDALNELMRIGWAEAYHLRPDGPATLLEVQQVTNDQGVYYLLTERGREAQVKEYPDWPFNSDGLLREDWDIHEFRSDELT